MLNLTQSQESVGRTLHRGQSLAMSGKLSVDETATIHNQMSVVNDRWESVRQSAMERQAKLQDRLMHLQQMELDAMRVWLDDMEQRMVDAEAISDQADKVQEQTALHRVR